MYKPLAVLQKEERKCTFDFDATSGSLIINFPGLPQGIIVTRGNDTYLVNAGTTLNERDDIMVRMEKYTRPSSQHFMTVL